MAQFSVSIYSKDRQPALNSTITEWKYSGDMPNTVNQFCIKTNYFRIIMFLFLCLILYHNIVNVLTFFNPRQSESAGLEWMSAGRSHSGTVALLCCIVVICFVSFKIAEAKFRTKKEIEGKR